MANKLHLRIIAPSRIMYDDDVDMVILRAITGDMGILAGHEACTTILGYGMLRVMNNETERVMAVFGGFAEINGKSTTIITDMAEWAEEIDRARAEADKIYAEEALKGTNDELEARQVELKLRRTLVRLEVSDYPLIKGNIGTK